MNKTFPDCLGIRRYRILGLCLLVLVCCIPAFAQSTSRAPVLISENYSTRALSVDPLQWRGRFPVRSQVVWTPDDQTRVTLFVTNLDLLKEEGASAFRAYVQDETGRQIRLTVESMRPVAGFEWIQAVVIRLRSDIGNVGDVLLSVTWRGMSSNRVRLAMGYRGGGPKDDAGAIPTAAPLTPPAPIEPFDPDQAKSTVARLEAKYSVNRTRFMEQATFGPSPQLNLVLRRIPISAYLFEQLDAPFPSTPYPTLPLQPDNIPAGCTGDCIRDNYTMYPLQRWFYTDALYGHGQVRRRVSWALHQILVTSGQDITHPSRMLPYIQVLDKNAFGSFRQLLSDITLNPAMGDYLDMIRSTRNNPNENYAREILQLFSIGLFQLNQDGTLMLDGNNNPIPTYDQTTVNNFTEVFTGWNLNPVSPIPGTRNYIDQIVLNQNNHDVTTKTLLSYPGAINTNLPAGQNGLTDLNQALDNIFNHPNVGPFISKQLIQHLVTSDPTPAYVGRVAAVFNNNGFNVRGDLKAVVKTILLDPEARGSDFKTDPAYGHLREPVLYVTNILRQFNVRAANGAAGSVSDGYLNPQTTVLLQDVFRPPSVFNYYSPDYIVPISGILGPEFFLMTTSTALRRANFANTAVFNTIPVQGTNAPNGTSIDLSEMQGLSTADSSGALLIETLNKQMLHGTMSTEMRDIISTAVLAVPSSNPLLRARTAIYLVATSSQYQVQR